MALLVAIRSERTDRGFGGAVEMMRELPDPRRACADNRRAVAEVLRLMAEHVERGEVDDLLRAEASA